MEININIRDFELCTQVTEIEQYSREMWKRTNFKNIINWRDVQTKNVVNHVDMSCLRAPWPNGPYKN